MKMKLCSWESPQVSHWLGLDQIIKSDYAVSEDWMKISCLTINYKAPDRHFHFAPLAMETNTCSHHPLPIPFSIIFPSLHYPTAPTFYMPWCSVRHRETIWGEIMLSWALALWNATKNRDWFASAELLPTKYFIAWLHISGFSPFATLTPFFFLTGRLTIRLCQGLHAHRWCLHSHHLWYEGMAL